MSGGAQGIESAAQAGALGCCRASVVVHAAGSEHAFPVDPPARLEEPRAAGCVSVWPFAPGTPAHLSNFRARNAVLVALSDAVVLVQAGARSGSRHAAGCARKLGRPLWVVPPAPWATDGFEGSLDELLLGARPLFSSRLFLGALGLAPEPARETPAARRQNEHENMVLSCLGARPIHVDELIGQTGLSAAEVATALLTLSLEDVVVEPSARCFRLPVRHLAT